MSERETRPGHRVAMAEADTVAAVDVTLTDPASADRDRATAVAAGSPREVDEGDYRVEAEIARGGMGRILRARDQRHRRVVALKEILSVSAASRARFEREALITARLQHPGIVPVYELASWRSGEPFYAMKMVEGQSLSAAIEAAGTPRERLALLPKVIAAVDAIAYAHQQRVIHRDLKPSNILVGGFGETVVIDWGLAKDLDAVEVPENEPGRSSDSELTVAGSVMGTPVYMPIEQARGDELDERADVYALGAILYHLVAGVPPYRARSADGVLELVRQKPPVPLAELDVDVPDDLVTIIDKAMARDREDRYRSGVELAAELERFSAGQLVGAHRYTIWSLARRWVARHRAAVITAGLALVALAVTSTVMIREIIAERNAAQTARADAEKQRRLAEDQRQRAEGLVDFMLADLRGKLAPQGQLALLSSVAERAREYAAGAPLRSAEEVERQRQIAELVGDVRLSSGELEAAETAYREQLALANRLAGVDSKAATAVAEAHRNIARALSDRGERAAALAELETAREELESLPPEARDAALAGLRIAEGTIKMLSKDLGGASAAFEIGGELLEADWQRRGRPAGEVNPAFQIQARLADIEMARGNHAKALAIYEALSGEIDRAPIPETGRAFYRARTALKRGNALAGLGRDTEAREAYRQSAAIVKRLGRDDPDNRSLLYDRAVAIANQAELAGGTDAADAALYREAIALMQRALEGGEGSVEWRGYLGHLHANLGLLLLRSKPRAARRELERAVAILEELESSGRLVDIEGHRESLIEARRALARP